MALLRLLLAASAPAVGIAVVLVVLALVRFKQPSRRSSLPLPPGPRGEPILGHLRIIPSRSPEDAYRRWSKEYASDILSFHVLGQPIIVLNSATAAVDLLEKRGANYADRPSLVLLEILGWKKSLTFMRWGKEFRIHRRIVQKSFSNSVVARYQPVQMRESTIMLKSILDAPLGWDNALRRFSTAVVLGIGFGINVKSDQDPFIKIAVNAGHGVSNFGAPGGTPVDFFPFLQFLPRCFHDRSLKFVNDWSWATRDLYDKPFEAVFGSTDRSPSLVSDMLDQRQQQLDEGLEPELSHDDIKGAGATIFAAGNETTWGTLVTFIFSMVLHPQIQAKAQRLIDDVVGRDRLPAFEDRPRLEYIDFLVHESLRWVPVAPIGVPHRSVNDDVYRGHFIPAGSVVIANTYAMGRDESLYTDPDTFNPDRYLPKEQGGLGEPIPLGPFGFGRRSCPGKLMAEASLWLTLTSILSTMKIEKTQDSNGHDIEPAFELTSGLASHIKKFPCRITPRDDRAAALVRAAEP